MDQSLRTHTDTVILLKYRLIAPPSVQTEQLGPTAVCLNSFSSLLNAYIQIGLELTVSFVPAVLAAGAPEQAAFMSDEAMESVPGLKPIQYTAKHYALYLGKMVEKTEKLNKGETVIGTVVTSVLVNFWFDVLGMQPGI